MMFAFSGTPDFVHRIREGHGFGAPMKAPTVLPWPFSGGAVKQVRCPVGRPTAENT